MPQAPNRLALARNVTSLVGVALTTAAVVTAAQAPSAPRAQTTATRNAFTVGPGVLLRVTVSKRPDLTNTYRVDPVGMLVLPHVGPVSVNGLSLHEASNELAARIAAATGTSPNVRVEFDRSSQSVFVAGQVRLPGLVTMKGPLSLMKVLARAGSPTAAASDAIVVIHDEIPPESVSRAREARTQVDLKDLQAGHDVLLHDGDTVFVPKAQMFYILGEVRRPGAYVLDPGMTMTQAIALAGGLTPRGSDRGIEVLRSVDGKAAELDADPGRVIQADDTIRIRARLF